MEIAGIILQITKDFIRIETTDKKQQVDVFYTKTNSADVKGLMVHQMVKLCIKLQSVDFNNEKLARCWLGFIVNPIKRFEVKVEEEASNWAQRRMEGK